VGLGQLAIFAAAGLVALAVSDRMAGVQLAMTHPTRIDDAIVVPLFYFKENPSSATPAYAPSDDIL
jgi:hypothetical protein